MAAEARSGQTFWPRSRMRLMCREVGSPTAIRSSGRSPPRLLSRPEPDRLAVGRGSPRGARPLGTGHAALLRGTDQRTDRALRAEAVDRSGGTIRPGVLQQQPSRQESRRRATRRKLGRDRQRRSEHLDRQVEDRPARTAVYQPHALGRLRRAQMRRRVD